MFSLLMKDRLQCAVFTFTKWVIENEAVKGTAGDLGVKYFRFYTC